MSAHAVLRLGTRAAHDRVDALFSDFDLSDRLDYARFLGAQAMAFVPVEAALDAADAQALFPDWPRRRRADRLRSDLEALGVPLPAPLASPLFGSPAAIAGGVYVLEGSRLGGAMLARSVPGDLPRDFLAAPQPPRHWRGLLALLEQHLPSPAEREEAARSARRVFDRFASAASHATLTQ